MEREIKPFHVSKWCALQSACIEMNHHYQRIVNGNALKEDTQGVMGVGYDAPHILNIIRSSVNTLNDTFAVDSSKKLPVPLMPGLGAGHDACAPCADATALAAPLDVQWKGAQAQFLAKQRCMSPNFLHIGDIHSSF